MNITREDSNELNAVIRILVEKKDYEKNVADKLKDYRKKIALPGFRPGYVPASLIQRRFGKSILAEEVNQLLNQNLTGYFREQNISILGEPLPNEKIQKEIDWDSDQDFEFVFDIALAPTVEINFDKANIFPYYRIMVSEEMIDQRIESILQQMGSNKPVDLTGEKSIVKGDFCQLDDDGTEKQEGISPEGVMLSVDQVKDETVRNGLIGKKAGDVVVFDPVKAFENRHEVGHMLNITHEEADKLNGLFRFTVREIMDFEPARPDEELFEKLYGENPEVNTVEKFREEVRKEIAGSLSYSSDQKFAVDARQKLLTDSDIALPEEFLKRWLKAANKGLSDEEIEKDFGAFLTDLRWQLIKKAIVNANNITVQDEEVSGVARRMALSQYNQYGVYNVSDEQLERLAKMILEKEEEKERINRIIIENKILQVVKEQAGIEFREVSHKEFGEMMNPEHKD